MKRLETIPMVATDGVTFHIAKRPFTELLKKLHKNGFDFKMSTMFKDETRVDEFEVRRAVRELREYKPTTCRHYALKITYTTPHGRGEMVLKALPKRLIKEAVS